MVIGSESPPAATPVSPGRNFCTHCGAKLLPDTVYCPACGQHLKPTVAEKESVLPPEPKNCPRCGGGPLYPNEGVDGKTYFCGQCKKDVTELVRKWQAASTGDVPSFPINTVMPKPNVSSIPVSPPASTATPAQVQKQKIEVPPSVDHWSWPAFLFGWIWAWGTGLYIWPWIVLGILVVESVAWLLIPLTMTVYFGLYIYFGIRGNRHLYQTGRFQNAEHFLEVERKWNQAVVILLVASVSLGIILGLLLSVLISTQ